MSDATQLDQHLYRLASESVARQAANVDVDAEFSVLQARLSGIPTVAPRGPRQERTRWLVAAAAGILVVAGITAITVPVSYTHLTLPTNREV